MMKRMCWIQIAPVLAALILAPVPVLRADNPPCPAGTDHFVEYRLFFGRSQGAVETVTDAAWREFLAEEIAPRFPDGLTVLDAAGQWRDSSGTVVRERSKVVLVLAAPGAGGMQHTREIAQAYRRTFGPESVRRTISTACVSF